MRDTNFYPNSLINTFAKFSFLILVMYDFPAFMHICLNNKRIIVCLLKLCLAKKSGYF